MPNGNDQDGMASRLPSFDTDKMFACINDARRSTLDGMPTLSAHGKTKSVELLRYEMEVPVPKSAKKVKAKPDGTLAPAPN